MSRPLRIGIIGAGANTRLRHIPGFQALDEVEVIVVCNRSKESSQKVADEFNIPRVAEKWQEVIADPEVDAICIGTWPYLHAAASIAAIEAGKHLLTEARMAMNVTEAEQMIEAARAHDNVVCQIVPAPFTLDIDAAAQRAIAEEVGALREICVTHAMGLYAPAEIPLTWRQRADLSGHNVLTLGIYHEMVLRWIGENPEWVVADAEIFHAERYEPESNTSKPVDLPESLSVLGRLKSGTRLIYHFSGVEVGPGRNEIRINGSKACLRADLSAGKLFITRIGDADEVEISIPEEEKRGWQVEADFVDSIRSETPVRLTSFEEGLRYMEFTDAVTQSYRNGGEKTMVGEATALSY